MRRQLIHQEGQRRCSLSSCPCHSYSQFVFMSMPFLYPVCLHVHAILIPSLSSCPCHSYTQFVFMSMPFLYPVCFHVHAILIPSLSSCPRHSYTQFVFMSMPFLYPVFTEQNDLDLDLDDIFLDCDPEDAPVYKGRIMFNITKDIIFVIVAQSLFDGPDRKSPNICIKIIPITIQIEC